MPLAWDLGNPKPLKLGSSKQTQPTNWNIVSNCFSNVFQLGTLASKLQAQEVSWRCCLLNPWCYQPKLLVAELRTSFLTKDVHGKGWIAHPKKTKQQANRPQGTRAHKEVQKVTKTWTNAPRPEQFHKSSSQVQVQDNPKNQVPRTCNKQTWYDPQLQGCLIWLCHLSHDPLAATSLDHLHTLV